MQQSYILNLALALTFLAMAVKAFVAPEEINHVIEHAQIFKNFLDKIPLAFIGIHDALIGVLIILRLWPKWVLGWTVIWIGGVILLQISSLRADGLLDAVEHAAALGIALYLFKWSK